MGHKTGFPFEMHTALTTLPCASALASDKAVGQNAATSIVLSKHAVMRCNLVVCELQYEIFKVLKQTTLNNFSSITG
jgi:hypothetical protein